MKLPSMPTKGASIAQWCRDAINFMRASRVVSVIGGKLVETPNGTAIVIDNNRDQQRNVSPPFWPCLITKTVDEAVEYYIGLTRGVVTERVTGPDGSDAVNNWVPANLEDENGIKLTAIEVGQSIYISCHVAKEGNIKAEDGHADPVKVEVAEAEKKSTHYYPPGGDSTGSAGDYYYEMARLESVAGKVSLRLLNCGSNIDHFADLPQMENTGSGSVGRVFQKFDKDDNQYKFRVITAESPLAVEETTDEIKVKMENGGKDLDLSVYSVTISFSGETVTETLSHILCWRNGIFVGKFANASAEGYPTPVGTLETSKVSYIQVGT